MANEPLLGQSGWTPDDDKARAVYELRVLMRRQFGVNTEGLTDDEVLLIFQRRLEAFGEAIKPIVERLREAGLLPPRDGSRGSP